MTTRLIAIAASLLLLAPQLADAQALTSKELKKKNRQAGKAYEAGQSDRAVELYGEILAATEPGDSQRGDALYVVAMARLAPEGPGRDAARRHLDELTASFPRHPRRLEISAVRQLLGDLASARIEVTRRTFELEERLAELEAERRQVEAQRQEIEGETEAVGGEVKSLRAQLRRTRAELTETRGELDKKEEALQKLKDALVSRAGGG